MSFWKRLKIGLKVASVGLKVASGIVKGPVSAILAKIADGIDQVEPQLPEAARKREAGRD